LPDTICGMPAPLIFSFVTACRVLLRDDIFARKLSSYDISFIETSETIS